MSLGLDFLRVLRWVDPDGGRGLWRFWWLADEPLGCAEKRGVEGDLAGCVKGARLPEVDLVGRHQADACVMMLFVVPGCEAAAECAGLFDRPEPFGEFRLIFQRLEVGLRERIVVGGMRPAQGI